MANKQITVAYGGFSCFFPLHHLFHFCQSHSKVGTAVAKQAVVATTKNPGAHRGHKVEKRSNVRESTSAVFQRSCCQRDVYHQGENREKKPQKDVVFSFFFFKFSSAYTVLAIRHFT
jgi:hypothetical protein